MRQDTQTLLKTGWWYDIMNNEWRVRSIRVAKQIGKYSDGGSGSEKNQIEYILIIFIKIEVVQQLTKRTFFKLLSWIVHVCVPAVTHVSQKRK